MQALARFAMRGRSQAALVAATAAVLSVLPFIGLLTSLVSAGVIVLTTLRHGAAEGLLVTALAGLGGGLLAWLALSSPLPTIGFLLTFWLPAWLLSVVLGWSRSLSVTAQVAVLIALPALGILYLLSERLMGLWQQILEPLRQLLIEAEVVDPAQSHEVMTQVVAWMPGLLTATVYLLVLSSLLLGRWWQALLYKPGAFGLEYRALRVHPVVGILAIAAYVVVIIVPDAHWALTTVLILGTLLLLQGLAVLHALRLARHAHVGWLVGLYVLFFIGFPFPQMAVSGLGLADIWVDFRSRLKGRGQDRS